MVRQAHHDAGMTAGSLRMKQALACNNIRVIPECFNRESRKTGLNFIGEKMYPYQHANILNNKTGCNSFSLISMEVFYETQYK